MTAKWKQIETYLKKLKKEDAPTVSISKGGVDFNPTGLSKKKKKELDGRTTAYKVHRRKLEAQREKRKKMRSTAEPICGSFRENLEGRFNKFNEPLTEGSLENKLYDILESTEELYDAYLIEWTVRAIISNKLDFLAYMLSDKRGGGSREIRSQILFTIFKENLALFKKLYGDVTVKNERDADKVRLKPVMKVTKPSGRGGKPGKLADDDGTVIDRDEFSDDDVDDAIDDMFESNDLKEDFKRDFEKNEKENHHSANALLIVKLMGTSKEQKIMDVIVKRTDKIGHTNDKDSKIINLIHKKYASQIRSRLKRPHYSIESQKEEVELQETVVSYDYSRNPSKFDSELDKWNKKSKSFPHGGPLKIVKKLGRGKYHLGGDGQDHLDFLDVLNKLGIEPKVDYIKAEKEFKFTDQMIKKLKEDKLEEDNMKTLEDIIKTRGAKPLKFRDGQIKVDMQTANIILRVIPKVRNKSTLDKMMTIINQGRKSQFTKLVSSLQSTLAGSFTNYPNGIRNRPI